MRTVKIGNDLRTSAEWREWALAKITGMPRDLTYSAEIIDGELVESGEIAEMKLGDCIEFDPGDPSKQHVNRSAARI